MALEWIRDLHARREERRLSAERRNRHVLFNDWRWAIEGRRQRSSRRDNETAETGVDLYDSPLFVIALSIFILSCMDATLTLTLIARGVAYEANPFMNALMSQDPQLFINLKIVFTGAGLLFLVALADARLLRFVRVRNIMHGLLIIYSAVVGYQLVHLVLTG